MPTPADRFEVLAPLPSLGGFRRALAVDRGGPPRAVILAYPPARVADDPARLAELVRDAEAAARVHHPNVAPVLGLETVGEAAAVVEVYAAGPTLRDLLDAGGRLPPDLAARVVADACAGVARAHAVDPGDGRPFAHGALGAERLVVAEDGATRVTGLGAAGGGDPAADVRALGAILHECLAGEPAAAPPRPLEGPGIPPALAGVVDRALGAAPGAPATAAALGSEIEAALPPAPAGAVAAYAEAILPSDEGDRAALARLVARSLGPAIGTPDEVSAELIVDEDPAAAAPPAPSAPAVPPAASVAPGALAALAATVAPPAPASREGLVVEVEPTPLAVVRPGGAAPAPPPESVKTFAAPRPAEARSRAPLVAALVFGAAGLALGFAGARGLLPLPAALGELLPAAIRPSATSTATPTSTSTGRATSISTPPSTGTPTASTPSGTSTSTPAPTASASPPSADAPEPPPAAKPAKPARHAATRTTAKGKGLLEVNAPAEADVFLDGRRIGKGSLKTEIPDGAHRIEVRLGEERAGERFRLEPGETWTYDVTTR